MRWASVIGPLIAASLVGAGGNPAQVLSGLLPFVLAGTLACLALVWRLVLLDNT